MGELNPSLASPRAGSRWYELSSDAAVRACRTYGVNQIWVPTIVECTLGIVAVESRFGRSPRYRAKEALRCLLAPSKFLLHFAPQAQGIAQIDQGRAEYLAHDAALDHDLHVGSRDGAIAATALGLAKAALLHYPRRAQRPSRSCCANVVITHNAGWMTPKVARLQEVLAKLGLLAVDTQRNGFVGPRTRAALDLAASRFGCPTLRETLRDHGISAPPEWGLTHPSLFPLFRQSALFESLQHAAAAVGESLDEPKFPEYRIRRWYTGWISSRDYARAVLAHAEGWRKKSTTSLGGSPSSNARYRVS